MGPVRFYWRALVATLGGYWCRVVGHKMVPTGRTVNREGWRGRAPLYGCMRCGRVGVRNGALGLRNP